MKKHFINKDLAGFVTFYFALCLILVYSNIVKTYEMLLTYNIHIRNTDPCFHLVSCYEKHFRSQMKNAVSYKQVLTVLIFIVLKGNLWSKKSQAQMKEHENCKKTSHHRPQCAKWFSRYSISKSGI